MGTAGNPTSSGGDEEALGRVPGRVHTRMGGKEMNRTHRGNYNQKMSRRDKKTIVPMGFLQTRDCGVGKLQPEHP